MIFAGKDCPHGIDVDVWNAELYGHPDVTQGYEGVMVTVYPMHLGPDGVPTTDLDESLLQIRAEDLDPEVWGESEWYGLDDSTAPGDFPSEILALLTPHIIYGKV